MSPIDCHSHWCHCHESKLQSDRHSFAAHCLLCSFPVHLIPQSTCYSQADYSSNDQCGHLARLLGSKVSFPNSTTYLATERAYWSLQEAELSPTCIVAPSTPADVSTFLSQIAGNERCPFAIKGGGHAPQAGSANIVSQVIGIISPRNKVSVKF